MGTGRRFFSRGGRDHLPGLLAQPQEVRATRDIYLASAAGKQAVVADAVETLWGAVEEKAPDKRAGGERHGALGIAMSPSMRRRNGLTDNWICCLVIGGSSQA